MIRNKGFLRGFKAVPGIVLGILLGIVSCAEVSITHRHSLHLVPDSELMTLSYQQYNQVLHQSHLSTDTQEVDRVRLVGSRIARAAETFLREAGQGDTIKNYHWEFNLIEAKKTADAWVMPAERPPSTPVSCATPRTTPAWPSCLDTKSAMQLPATAMNA
jgi:hypothetical protein